MSTQLGPSLALSPQESFNASPPDEFPTSHHTGYQGQTPQSQKPPEKKEIS